MPRPIRSYARNSPQALARAVFMMMITDGELGELELAALERLHVLRLIGIDQSAFAAVARDYCSDLLACADTDGRIRLVDVERIDAVLEAIDEPSKRLLVCALILNIAAAQSRLHAVELELLRYVFARWQLDPDNLARQLGPDGEPPAPRPLLAAAA